MTRRNIRRSPEALAARKARREKESADFLRRMAENSGDFIANLHSYMIRELEKRRYDMDSRVQK